MRIIIAGSRDFNNYAVLKHNIIKILLELSPIEEPKAEIISGTARGADQLGERFAKEYNYSIKKCPLIGICMVNLLVIKEMNKWQYMQRKVMEY